MLHPQGEALQGGDPALLGGMDDEDVARLDDRPVMPLPSRAARAALENARRVVSPTSRAAGPSGDAPTDEQHRVDARHERRLGRLGPGRHRDHARDEHGEDAPARMPPGDTTAREDGCRSRRTIRRRRRRRRPCASRS